MSKTTKRRPGRPPKPKAEMTKTTRMTGRAFNAWMDAAGFTDSEAARQLGTAPSTIARYRADGGPALLALACSAISAGLSPWKSAR